MTRFHCFAVAGAAIVLLAIPGIAQAQIGPGPFAAFPTEVENDGRFLGFACSALATLEEPVSISLTVPADASQFDLSFFDGETGKPDGAGKPHWDLGGRQLSFTLYADPLLNADQSMVIGQWFGNDPNPLTGPLWTASAVQMPDNDWWGVTVQTDLSARAPSGRYFYNLVIDFVGACNPGENTESSVKVAASAPMAFLVPQFALVAPLRQLFNDGPILYPGPSFPPPAFVSAPTTYDGTFSVFFTVAPGAEELRIFDGDFDHGTAALTGLPSGAVLAPCLDDDDQDTPADYLGFPFGTLGSNLEGVAAVAPPDDNHFDAFRRGEIGSAGRVGCVRYEVTDPNGVVYRNDNPSGDREWEQFRIATQLAVNPNDADYGPVVAADGSTFVVGDHLPAGMWTLRIVGLDLSNLNVLALATCANQLDPATGETIPACLVPSVYLAGDTVWYDDDGDGFQDAGEAGVSGVVVNLYDDSGSGIPLATATTGDSSDPNWIECVANNTGLDTGGLYCFGLDRPGVHTVEIDPSNFVAGGALAGLSSTTGGEELTFEVIDANVLTYDFGYVAPPPPPVVGDTVWLDSDEDGVQDAGEPGIAGVTVEVYDGAGDLLATAVTGDAGSPDWATCQAVNTGVDEAGLYCFTVAGDDDYTVRVASSNFAAGGALEGLSSTIDTDEITEVVADGDVLTFDLPYAPEETGGECPDPLDFDTDAGGNPLAKGTIVTEQWAALGVHVTSHSPSHHPVMIFDSAHPTGGDHDLGAPNQTFGGPGIGNGGKAGQPGENRNPQGKVLILSEDGHHWDPDDDANGGWMAFSFDSPVRIDSVQILDIEENGGWLKAYDAGHDLIGQVAIPARGDNSFQEIAVGIDGVSKFKVWLKGSGAVARLAFCPEEGGGGGGCPPVIDWETDGQGNSLSKGTRITNQFAALGFQVISHNPGDHPAMIFDSSYPTGGDRDLGTPNEDFGGPGKGNGGDAGSTYENRNAHGKVLILSEDGHHWDPDDDASGGWVYFVFDSPVTVDWVQLLDIEESGGKLRTYNAGGSQIGEFAIPVIGDNGFVQVPVNKSGVSKLKVWLKGSGAVPAFSFCPDGGSGGEPPPAAPGTGTIGYWKTHPEAWPVAQVVIGGRTYTKSQAIYWMKKSSQGDKSIDLFKQLAAAVLNVEVGNESSCIDGTIADAQSFMQYVPVGSGLPGSHWAWRYIGGPLHEKLDDYNNGQLCAPHRD